MRTPDSCLPLSKSQIKLLRLNKKRMRYKRQARVPLSRDEMIQYLRDNGIHSSRVLERKRKTGEPNVNDYRKEFGSWSNAVVEAFGVKQAVDYDPEYILKAVYELELWTVRRFNAARKLDPVTVPSWRVIRREWGTYSKLFEYARRHNLKKLLDEYRKLIRKLGHIPSLDEIQNSNLRMDDAIKFYGSKKEMDEFVQKMGLT